MIDQHESALLAKLPLEIRYRIYELVFGDKIIIFKADPQSGLQHCLCIARGKKWHLMNMLNMPAPWCKCDAHGKQERTPRLPLLLTCRQMYVSYLSFIQCRYMLIKLSEAIPSLCISCGPRIRYKCSYREARLTPGCFLAFSLR